VKTAKRAVRPDRAPDAAARLETAIHALGNYGHVTIEAKRGMLYVLADDEPVARLSPIAGDQYGLSFHQHSGQWESTPFTGDLAHLARILTTEFGPYFDSYDFPPTTNGSAH
jgi:hypothetical protein